MTWIGMQLSWVEWERRRSTY